MSDGCRRKLRNDRHYKNILLYVGGVRMIICENCYNIGKLEGVGYCGCGHGMMRKAEVKKRMAEVKPKKVTGSQPVEIKLPTQNIHESITVSVEEYKIKEGDWVGIHHTTGAKGFVMSAKSYGCKIWIMGDYKKYRFSEPLVYFDEKSVYPLQPESVDPNILIDLALQTKDEEWFKQLTRGMAK